MAQGDTLEVLIHQRRIKISGNDSMVHKPSLYESVWSLVIYIFVLRADQNRELLRTVIPVALRLQNLCVWCLLLFFFLLFSVQK